MNKWKIDYSVPVELVDFTEKNANKMSNDAFNTLVSNIRVSGLSSVIVAYKNDDGRYTIISGNHRFKACLELGYSFVPIMYVNRCDITEDELIAIQISHNTLHGESDKSILRELFNAIKDIDFKKFAYVSSEDMKANDFIVPSVNPLKETYTLSVVLYRDDLENIEDILGMSVRNSDVVLMSEGSNEDTLLEIIGDIKKKYKMVSSNIAFSKLLELAKIGFNLDK